MTNVRAWLTALAIALTGAPLAARADDAAKAPAADKEPAGHSRDAKDAPPDDTGTSRRGDAAQRRRDHNVGRTTQGKGDEAAPKESTAPTKSTDKRDPKAPAAK